MADKQAKKRKAKAYYVQSVKQQKRALYKLDAGQKGFLCTCNNREKECVREAYNLLNEYADKLYGPENKAEAKTSAQKENEEEEDIADALAKEVSTIKEQSTNQVERRFKSVESGANNCIFIKTTVESPTAMVNSILEDIKTTGQQKSRFLIRLLPIEATCKGNLEDITRSVEPLIETHFPDVKTFSILFRVRNNNQMKRDEVIAAVAQMVTKRFPDIKPNLNDPDKSIIIEIVQKHVCLGVVSRYFDFAKYNILEFAQKQSTKAKSEGISDPVSQTSVPISVEESSKKEEKPTEIIPETAENANKEVNTVALVVGAAENPDKEVKTVETIPEIVIQAPDVVKAL
nr:EOG090X0GPG [Lepidurus arcticus]